MSKKMIILISIVMCLSVFTGTSRAADEDLFVTVTTPDALIVMDLSTSMDSNPADGSNSWANDTCTGTFYSSSGTGHTKRCRKIDIAKYALFDLLDDDNNNEINSADVSSLGIRLGLMRFYNVSSNGSDTASKVYTDATSKIQLSWGITQADNTTTTPYANIFCNNATCSSPNTTGSNSCTVTSPTKECFVGYGVSNYTPLQYSLREAKRYLDAHKALDDSRTCRQKSVIFITDGADTVSCSANGSTNISQRRAPVYQAKVLAAAGYKVYVVGFGATMPSELKRTLNWMAYYGGTRNPSATQTTVPSFTVGADPCTSGSDPGALALDGYAFMASNPAELSSALKAAITSIQEANYSFSSQASVAAARVQQENFLYEASFEPKNTAGSNKEPFWVGHLKKYELNSEGGLITPNCWDAGVKMRDQASTSRNMWTYKGSLVSFTTANITAADLGVTTTTRRDEIVGFYRGDATYNLESWKLGDIFHSNPVTIKTPAAYFYDPRQYGAAAFKSFRSDANNQRTAANGKQLILVGANDGQLHAIRAGNSTDCTSGGDEVWSFIPPNLLQKIAPIAHTAGSSVTPLVAGHLYRTALASHAYFVDGPLEIADVWLPSSASSGTSKAATDWKTIAIFGEGQGSGSYLWSSSSTCYSASTTGFSATYSATYPYYCGYYALDVTNTVTAAQPVYKWHLGGTNVIPAAQAPYLGEAWSKMKIGRVNISGNERWVGFIGGGFNNAACASADTCNAVDGKGAGKGFFVVDLTNGNIIWSYTRADNANMVFSAPAAPLPVDLDNDGFIDTVYMGDMGGNMWRFRLCAKDAVCSASTWTGSLLYQTTAVERGSGLTPASYSHKQIFTAATATMDTSGNVWVYFGTGENNDPTIKPTDTSDTKNRLFGIKEDPDFTATYTTSNLKDITSSTFCTAIGTGCTAALVTSDTTTKHGWYINLSTNPLTRTDLTTISNPVGEKMISDPTVFGGVVYFTTHVPDQGAGSACGLSGDAFLYGINYLTGSGELPEPGAPPPEPGAVAATSRTNYIGHGIGSAPVLSMRPGGTGLTDIYATASGGAGTSALTQKLGNAPATASMNNILYWKDRRLQ